MRYVCLWTPTWSTAADVPADRFRERLAPHTPRLVVDENGQVWCDGRGLDVRPIARELLSVAEELGVGRTGIGDADIPVAAEVAARTAPPGRIRQVPPGSESDMLSSVPLEVLQPSARLLQRLNAVGVKTAGQLAALRPADVELRFGRGGRDLWSLARAEDLRLLFGRVEDETPRERVDFMDYVLVPGDRLFGLLATLLERLMTEFSQTGRVVAELRLQLLLDDRSSAAFSVEAAHPTADPSQLAALVRRSIQRDPPVEPIQGVEVAIVRGVRASSEQTDLFDRGAATADAVQRSLSQVVDEHGGVLFAAAPTAHPLPGHRSAWAPLGVQEAVALWKQGPADDSPATLHLFLRSSPEIVAVDTAPAKPAPAPHAVEIPGEGKRAVTAVAGPWLRSITAWSERSRSWAFYACLIEDGLILLAWDAEADTWYLGGRWL